MKLVSFYADVDGTTNYSDNAENLMRQCAVLGVDCYIVEKDFGGTWIDNVRAKPLFLLEVLDKLDEPFLWLDCDCRILKPLDFFVKSDWGVYMREDGTPHDFVHYISGSRRTRKFLQLWVRTIEQQKRGSHTAFISIFHKIKSEILPKGYFELGLADSKSKNAYFNEHP